MTTSSTRRQLFESEGDFLSCVHWYLSGAFPNPERQGCPPDETLNALVSQFTQTSASVSDHLICCSPCFNAYMTHLRHAKAKVTASRRIRRIMWLKRSLVAATVLVVLVTISVRISRREVAPTVARTDREVVGAPASPNEMPAATNHVQVEIDLSDASPVRGRAVRKISHLRPRVIPSTAFLDLNVLLPLGSEERTYSAKLCSEDHVIWAGSAKAHQENGQTLLHMQSDLSHVPEASYEFVVFSQGFRVAVPVIVKNISSGKIQ